MKYVLNTSYIRVISVSRAEGGRQIKAGEPALARLSAGRRRQKCLAGRFDLGNITLGSGKQAIRVIFSRKTMEWTFVIAMIVAVVTFVLFKRMAFIPVDTARKHLAAGALVIDVRSPEEFRAGHLSKAVNIPLGELETAVLREVKEKDQVLLLHCLSGGRSEVARQRLKRLGYSHVYNLGPFGRAKQIAGE